MESPQQPSIPLSPPGEQHQLATEVLRSIWSPDTLTQIEPTAIGELLSHLDLDVDDSGFIIHSDTREYSTPYAFSPNRFEEIDSPVESVFESYFVEAVSSDDVMVQSRNCLHLSDVHSFIIGDDDRVHPVRHNISMLERFILRTGMQFSVVVSWSAAIPALHSGEHGGSVDISVATLGGEEDSLPLNCFGPECGYRGPADTWEGEVGNPTCPDCGGEWTEDINVCLNCQEWHWGTHFEGDGMHAMPSCPNCGAGLDMLERQTRYDDFEE